MGLFYLHWPCNFKRKIDCNYLEKGLNIDNLKSNKLQSLKLFLIWFYNFEVDQMYLNNQTFCSVGYARKNENFIGERVKCIIWYIHFLSFVILLLSTNFSHVLKGGYQKLILLLISKSKWRLWFQSCDSCSIGNDSVSCRSLSICDFRVYDHRPLRKPRSLLDLKAQKVYKIFFFCFSFGAWLTSML